ncbi:zinc finger protein 311-like [Galleria mellonella]|uniref:Zinc finger protein 311-like n=1 Tax=Galleria mellonella TaxID=7137 RepID=A0ABM3MAA2_GALME|nr:zinc finger protein 311-like [Galleria mellonella]
MNLELSTNNSRSICEGCLSIDRKLTPICDDETRSFYTYLVDQMDHINHGVLLCWECMANMRRMLNFRRQVQTARNHIIRYMLQEMVLLPLTRLSVKNNNIIYDVTETENESKQQNHIYNSDTTNNPNRTQNSDIDLKTKNSVGNIECIQNSVQPLTFLKVERQDDEFVDMNGFFVDENYEDVIENNDEKVTEMILKSDSFEYGEPKHKPKKTRKTRRKTNEDEFNESDDEPLKKKTEDKKYKPRGRRKKKETDQDEKVDRRKHPRPKREKPAGVVSNARVDNKLRQLNVPSGQLEMVLLTWEEVEAERQQALTSVVFTRHEYRCYDCVLGFNYRFKLENHMKKHDPAAGELACGVCGVRCRHAHALAAHRRRHRLRWRCVSCGGTWSRAAVAADHHARVHGAPAPTHTCAACGHRATSLGKLRNHIKNHAERQKCELCGKTFRDRASLRTHLFIHRGEKEHACPRCGKRFLFKKAMQLHLVTHDAPAHLYCHQCDMNFKNRMSYYQHMRYNLRHIDPARLKHECGACGKRFAKAARLQEHRAAVHLKATPVRCPVPGCGFACASRAALRAHSRGAHRGARPPRNHVCHACGKAYTTKKTLEGHMRSHTGERPFKCAQCPSTFGYEAALYNHNKLVHLKVKSGRGRQASSTVPAAPLVEAPATLEPPVPLMPPLLPLGSYLQGRPRSPT